MLESPHVRSTLFALGGFVVGISFMLLLEHAFTPAPTPLVAMPPERPAKTTTAAATSTGDIIPEVSEATVRIEDQNAAATVTVSAVALSVPGWIVVHELTDGHVGNALGAARRDPGNHEHVVVELLRPTMPGSAYMLVLYRDNGNKEFEISADIPIVDEKGDPVMQRFETL